MLPAPSADGRTGYRADRWRAAIVVLLAASACRAQSSVPPDQAEIQPLLPAGISDFNLEIYGKLAYTWNESPDTSVVEVLGDFSARMGQYRLSSRDGVVWVRHDRWQDRPYIEVNVFLWQDARIVQPSGALESGPALLVTLRTFGKLALNADGHAGQADARSALYKEALKARALLTAAPAPPPEKATDPVQIAPSPEQLPLAAARPPKAVQFTAERLLYEQYKGESVVIAMDEVLVSQGSPAQSGEYLEIRADAAVIYLSPEQVGDSLPGIMGEEEVRRVQPTKPDTAQEAGAPRLGGEEKPDTARVREWASAVYLEGDVLLTRGQRMIRASRLFYDFDNEQALILDVVTRAAEPSRGVPIYVRASEVRQLSATEYEAHKAQFTTSEFHTPHVSIGADRVYLKDRTPRGASGEIIGVEAGQYKAHHTTLNLEGTPVAYWPFSQGDFSRDRMALRNVKMGYDGDFGGRIETQWYLFNLMGLEAPAGFDGTYKQDYFSDRGPAAGIDLDYQRDDYYGLLRSYYVHDDGEDDLGGDRGSVDPVRQNRGRFTWRHRQYLPKDWELTLETSYLSDANYLESWERSEFENGKDQENLIYLVKRQDNWQFSSLANWRINEFLTETEHLPDNVFSLIGEPLGEYATLYSESRFGGVRYRFAHEDIYGLKPDRTFAWVSTGTVIRGDTREELQFPLPDLGPLRLTPYVTGRLTGYDDSPKNLFASNGGGFLRQFGAVGLRGDTVLTRVDDSIESEFFDVHRLRHVIRADFATWGAAGNKNSDDLTPFDPGVDDISDFSGGTAGLRQKFQTQRGGPGNWRTVDWIILDLEAGFFNDPEKDDNTHGDYIFSRPEDSISSNFIATNFQYRISDSTVLVHDNVFDVNEGNLGTSNVTLAVEREPRLSYFVGWRYIHDTENNLLALGANYRLSEKHTIAFRELYDIEEGRNFSTEVVYIRRWPRWYTAVAFDVDKALDDTGITFSAWPEGAPRLGVGSKRYTGLAESVGIDVR